jgi:hypothetical protein
MTDEELEAIVPNNRDPKYGEGFMKFLDLDHGWSSWLVGQVVWLMFKPKSVIEFGCGTGQLLASLMEQDVQVLGVEGSGACLKFAERHRQGLSDRIIIHDLCRAPCLPITSFYEPRKADVAISIEVLEHLPEESADTMVKTICDASDLAIVTACPPTGRNPELHLNEKHFSYWVEKFMNQGMELNEVVTRSFRTIMRGFYSMHEAGYLPVVPAWLFSHYLGVFSR